MKRSFAIVLFAAMLVPYAVRAAQQSPGVFGPRMDAVWIPNDTAVDPTTGFISKLPAYKPGEINHHIIVYQGKDEQEFAFIDLRYKGVTLEWDKLTPGAVIVDPLRVTFEGGFIATRFDASGKPTNGGPLAGLTLVFQNTVGPKGVFTSDIGTRQVDEVRTVVGGTVFDNPSIAQAFNDAGIFVGAVAGKDFGEASKLLELPDGSIQ